MTMDALAVLVAVLVPLAFAMYWLFSAVARRAAQPREALVSAEGPPPQPAAPPRR
jgi:uncharacterized MAPEG superfamily protein